ncbi:hypothetical protein J3A83DRAFT_4381795 [Scleroderma citrinum]
MAQGQFTREEALAALNQQWYKGIAGDNHPEEEGKARANQPGRDGEAVLRDLGEQQHPQACPPPPECTPFPVDALDPINNPHLVTENPFNYDPKAQVASVLLNHPADYALKCLETFKFIHMWYFTRDGL